MDDPKYYYSMMIKLTEMREDSILELNKYKLIVFHLSNLKSNFEKISQTLEDAEDNYLQGGFLIDNISFDNGDLKYCYDTLRSSDNTIKNLIVDYQLIISEILENISLYDSKHFFAEKTYNELKNSTGTES